ncbi:MAG: hypothetical protein CFE23_04475 [Flavobacterium sp. BFFFF1]|uniref:DUF6327 family protein n=1 Tax=unclassified Flavobacterium TaxID=196869 RepID=UPI000BD622F3|nr:MULTISPECIES: DUF6327 family protein [unclassified Flavobacterium]OYU81356.1 MAG: hypothetical protein CFE23_04475 [Flavobacterium sp. BFFFF1]
MENKRYSSYEEIDRDLEILKLEKEIQFKKLSQSFGKTKDSLSPGHIIGGSLPKVAVNILSGLSGPIKGMALSFIMKKLFRF